MASFEEKLIRGYESIQRQWPSDNFEKEQFKGLKLCNVSTNTHTQPNWQADRQSLLDSMVGPSKH